MHGCKLRRLRIRWSRYHRGLARGYESEGARHDHARNNHDSRAHSQRDTSSDAPACQRPASRVGVVVHTLWQMRLSLVFFLATGCTAVYVVMLGLVRD